MENTEEWRQASAPSCQDGREEVPGRLCRATLYPQSHTGPNWRAGGVDRTLPICRGWCPSRTPRFERPETAIPSESVEFARQVAQPPVHDEGPRGLHLRRDPLRGDPVPERSVHRQTQRRTTFGGGRRFCTETCESLAARKHVIAWVSGASPHCGPSWRALAERVAAAQGRQAVRGRAELQGHHPGHQGGHGAEAALLRPGRELVHGPGQPQRPRRQVRTGHPFGCAAAIVQGGPERLLGGRGSGVVPCAVGPGTPRKHGAQLRLARYYAQGARFAKWRTALKIDVAAGQPTDLAIEVASQDLARYARICQENGLVRRGTFSRRKVRGGRVGVV